MFVADEALGSSGVVVLEEGRVYIRKVRGDYGGVKWSFAKGQREDGLSLEENALKELREEMGLEARIIGTLGDYKGFLGWTRFYVGERTGGDPTAFRPDETDEVRLVAEDEARELLNIAKDQHILADVFRWAAARR